METAFFNNPQTEELRSRLRKNRSFVAKTNKTPLLYTCTKSQLEFSLVGWIWAMSFLLFYTDVFISPLDPKFFHHYCGILLFTSMVVRSCVGYFRRRKVNT